MSDSETRVQLQDREIILLGTAHVSRESVDEAVRLIEEEEPGRVCVEIDESRLKSLTEENSWSKLNVYQVIKEGKGFLILANLVLSSFQRRLGSGLDVKPGEEMMQAYRAATERGVPVTLSDREIHVTLKRAWSKTRFWGKLKLLSALLGSIFQKEELTAEDIEELKKQNALENMMGELAAFLPSIKEVLIDERDRYLATSIFQQQEDKILAVVGAGHVPGIVSWLERLDRGEVQPDVADIREVPPKKKLSRILPWLIPAVVAGLFAYGFFRAGWQMGISMFGMWVLVNGSLSAVGALAALAHPLTILVTFASAPFTSLNPTIGVGFVSGLLEAVLRKPRVSDLEHLQDDISSFRGFFRNRFTHVLLVFFFASIGSAVGTFLAFPFILRLLG
ncbi:MAG: TraB/GumN family protein [Spirochaetales bacterium]|nr:TraB/GumN family protein [Spirochaetales bacterium]MCF7938053.1 TraB/GumN family protein [Spirochaetales bacterium]